MQCAQCGSEYNAQSGACPRCGAAPFPGTATFAPFPGAGERNLGQTVALSGSHSVRARFRPRTAPEIITEAFQIYREQWKLLLLMGLILYTPFMIPFFYVYQPLVATAMQPPSAHADFSHQLHALGWVMICLVFCSAACAVAYFALTRAVSDIYLGKQVRLAEIIRPNRRIWGYIGSLLLTNLILVGPFLLSFALFAVSLGHLAAERHSADPMAGVVVVLFACLLVVLASIFTMSLSVYFIVVPASAIVEGQGAWGSIRRGVSLVKGFYWKAVGVLLMASCIAGTVSGLVESPYQMSVFMQSFQGALAHPGMAPNMVFTPGLVGLGAVLVTLATIITVPFVLINLVLFYYDLRIRKEGFDLQMLAQQLGYGVQTSD